MIAPVLHPRRVLLLAASCFVALTAGVLLLGVLPADPATRGTLLAMASPAIVDVMRMVNYMGDWRVIAPGTALMMLVVPEARRRWWVWTMLMVAAPLAEGALKATVARPRPEDLSFGFPSGHATAAAAFFGAWIYLAGGLPPAARRAIRALAPLAIVLVGAARVILRAHWPSDVLGGVALGLALASAAALLADRPSKTAAV